jgi:hypothetical protein
MRPTAPNNGLKAAMADHCRKHAMQKPSQAKPSKQAKNEMERRNKTKPKQTTVLLWCEYYLNGSADEIYGGSRTGTPLTPQYLCS